MPRFYDLRTWLVCELSTVMLTGQKFITANVSNFAFQYSLLQLQTIKTILTEQFECIWINLVSRLSLEEAAGFSRDAFGRQSMSEKRHATLDAKNTDTYQRNKKVREEREKHRQEMIKQGSK